MSTIQTDESLLNKVASLLRKAERSDFEAEAAAFTAKAQELMARYSIDEAMIDSTTGEKPLEVVNLKFPIKGQYASRKVTLGGAVAQAVGCKCIFTDKGAYWGKELGYRYELEVFGTKADCEWAETLFNSLCTQMDMALKVAQRTQKSSYEHGKTFGTAFAAGFTSRVAQRLQQVRREAAYAAQKERDADFGGRMNGNGGAAVPNPTSVAMVLASKAERIEEEFRKAHPRTRTRQAAGVRSGGGYRAGSDAGSRASIARGGVGSSNNRALGR